MGILTWLIEALIIAGGLILWHFAKKENSHALKAAASVLVLAGIGGAIASTVRFVRYCDRDSSGSQAGYHWSHSDPHHQKGMFHLRGKGMKSSGPEGQPGMMKMDETVQKCMESAPKDGDYSATAKHLEACLKENLKDLQVPSSDRDPQGLSI